MIVLRSRPAAGEQRRLAQAACAEAARRGQPVLLSYSRDGASADALRLYDRAVEAGEDAAYWDQPSRGSVIVAAGAAWSLTLTGEGRCAAAAAAWGALAGVAVANRKEDMVALAGFAFAPTAARAPHWSRFGDGAMIVPELLYRCEGDRARVTLNVIVEPGQSEEDVAFRLTSLIDSPDGRPEPARAETGVTSRRDTVSADAWNAAVTALSAAIAAGSVEKVVLAREVALRAHDEIDVAALLARLREGYTDCTVFAFRRGGSAFVGATPERLVSVEGHRVRASCLAGSARRGADAEDDESAGAGLLADGKERREHQLVVSAIADALTPLCRTINVPLEPGLMRMPNVQHLYTPVEGTLARDVGLLELVERLHPTPAVGGMPRDAALHLIREHEAFDRGWYAGPVGWIDGRGDGEFAVAIRSALIDGREARLFAGCGIVAGSDPQREYDESSMKLRPMLWALGQA